MRGRLHSLRVIKNLSLPVADDPCDKLPSKGFGGLIRPRGTS